MYAEYAHCDSSNTSVDVPTIFICILYSNRCSLGYSMLLYVKYIGCDILILFLPDQTLYFYYLLL